MRPYLFIFLFLLSQIATAQDTIKIMQYNLLMYGSCTNTTLTQKDDWLRDIVGHHQPDIFTVNEMGDAILYANRIKQRALTYGNMEYTDFTNSTNSSIVNMLFYNKDKFGFKKVKRIGVSIRDINVYTMYHKASIHGADTLFIDFIVAHFKAGDTSNDNTQRKVAARSVMTWIENQGPSYQNYMFMGDFNLSSALDSAWQALVFHPNPDIRLQDPSGSQNGWGASNKEVLTQSPSTNRSDCGSGGGVDDRFDFILPSQGIMSGIEGVSYLQDSYAAYGNDGNTPYNSDLRCTGNTMVPFSVCASLVSMSDHLPVVMDIVIDRPTGIYPENFTLSGVELNAKNPFTDILEIQVLQEDAFQGALQLDLLAADGRLIHRHPLSNSQPEAFISLETGQLSPGLYLLRLHDDTGRQLVKKVIKW